MGCMAVSLLCTEELMLAMFKFSFCTGLVSCFFNKSAMIHFLDHLSHKISFNNQLCSLRLAYCPIINCKIFALSKSAMIDFLDNLSYENNFNNH